MDRGYYFGNGACETPLLREGETAFVSLVYREEIEIDILFSSVTARMAAARAGWLYSTFFVCFPSLSSEIELQYTIYFYYHNYNKAKTWKKPLAEATRKKTRHTQVGN